MAAFADSDDQDLREAAEEAIMMANSELEFDDEDFDDENDEGGWVN